MSTFEALLRELLDEQVKGEQPPSRISVSAAVQRGSKRLRWRRAQLAGPPVLAALAVLAIALSGARPFGGPARSGRPAPHRAASPAAAARAPGQLPVLRTDATFGWLPAGDSFTSGGTNLTVAYLNVYAGQRLTWQLMIYAGRACSLTGTSQLACSLGNSATQAYPLGGSAPAVAGHHAYWVFRGPAGRQHQEVVWPYASGGWAALQAASGKSQSSGTLLKIASGVRFGPEAGQPVKFAVQLAGLPRNWRLGSVSYQSAGGVLLARQEYVGDSGLRHMASLTVGLSSPGCPFYPDGQSRHEVVAGYGAVVTTLPSWDSRLITYQLCAPDVRGLYIFISILGRPVIKPTVLFTRMRVLGTGPANWVSSPIR
jgi:hypothetical protein